MMQDAEGQELLLTLLPFISEKSTLVLKRVSEAVDYVLDNSPESLVCSTSYASYLKNEYADSSTVQ